MRLSKLASYVAAFALLLILAAAPEHAGGSLDVWTDPVALNTNAASDSGADSKPQLATDGAGTWIAVWESTDSLGGTIGSDLDILVARSADNGITWTDPQPVNTDATADAMEDRDPHVATNGRGDWLVVWNSGPVTGDWNSSDIRSASSVDNGASWVSPTTIRGPGYYLPPRVTAAGNGWVVVFSGGTWRHIYMHGSVDNGATWEFLGYVAPIKDQSYQDPDIVTDGIGNWLVVWMGLGSGSAPTGMDTDILVSNDFQNAIPLNRDALTDGADDDDRWPRIATDGQGTWIAAWWLFTPTRTDVQVSRSTDGGSHWTNPISLSSHGPDRFPEVSNDGGSNWVMVWFGGPGAPSEADYDIWMSRSADGGTTWSAPATLNNNAAVDVGHDSFPDVATDGRGNWLAVWSSTDPLGGTIGTDSDILVARSTEPVSDFDGDVNCDGQVNVVDALFILQYEVGLRAANSGCPLPPSPPDTLNVDACDVNGDTLCNVVDALFVLQCEVGIPNTSCPVS